MFGRKKVPNKSRAFHKLCNENRVSDLSTIQAEFFSSWALCLATCLFFSISNLTFIFVNKGRGSVSTEDHNQLFFSFVCQLKVVNLSFKICPVQVLFNSANRMPQKKKNGGWSLSLYVAQFRGTKIWTNGDHKLWACPRLTFCLRKKLPHIRTLSSSDVYLLFIICFDRTKEALSDVNTFLDGSTYSGWKMSSFELNWK